MCKKWVFKRDLKSKRGNITDEERNIVPDIGSSKADGTVTEIHVEGEEVTVRHRNVTGLHLLQGYAIPLEKFYMPSQKLSLNLAGFTPRSNMHMNS